MENPPRRKRFQIHLSTAIVMMFAWGGLMWANTHVWFTTIIPTYATNSDKLTDVVYSYQGFPIPTIWDDVEVIMYHNGIPALRMIVPFDRTFTGIVDGCFALFILFLTFRISEWIIRHRAWRNGA